MHTCAIVLSYKYRCYIVKTIFFPTKWIKSELVSPLCEGNTYICRLEQWYIIHASFVSRVCLCILITACSNVPLSLQHGSIDGISPLLSCFVIGQYRCDTWYVYTPNGNISYIYVLNISRWHQYSYYWL